MARFGRMSHEDPPKTKALFENLNRLITPLDVSEDLNPLMDRIGEAPIVLLGEASHGTSEFYTWRAKITQRLIKEKGFNFIAVEGDWPDCYGLNSFIRGYPGAGTSAYEVLKSSFRRWPTWMWANREVEELAEWLREYNDTRHDADKVGFYGLDVYSLWESIDVLRSYLSTHYPDALNSLMNLVRCFEPFGRAPQDYARATVFHSQSCESEAVRLLQELREQKVQLDSDEREAYLQAEQNAVIIKNAEAYYRTMIRSGPQSWNLRDRHMVDTLERIRKHYGAQAKAVVWEHNTHIGDARYTDMAEMGEVNVGQLVREAHGHQDVVLVGFSTFQGSVIASTGWDEPMQVMPVPPGREKSWEDVLHEASGHKDKLLIFNDNESIGELLVARGHRAIGVVYNPETEQFGNYVPTVLPKRYDAMLYLDKTTALHPIPMRPAPEGEPPETFPFAV